MTLDQIIARIASLQSKGEGYFDEGLFPAYRSNPMIGYRRPDTTVFFTASIIFTLSKIKHLLSPQSQRLVEEISQKAIQNYPKFQNKDGLKTYNFWKTKPSKHFPNGYIFRHFEHFRIPDDIDDTAMIYLTSTPTPEELLWLKEKLPQHANLTQKTIRNTFEDYRGLRAYSTWFGKNMYIEFDACVLANMMYCIFEYDLPLNQHDHDSLTYIGSVVETDRYLTQPFRCAHQYPRTVPIVYHIARLMGAFQIPQLEAIQPKLVEDILGLLQKPQSDLDRIVLKTSLLRLGVQPSLFEVEKRIPEVRSFEDFYFFIAGLLTAYEQPLLYRFAEQPLFHIRWQCEAHCWTLMAEYLALLNEQ
ncbi:MAG: hypothetical protein ACK4GN_07560 [Runella sp.]